MTRKRVLSALLVVWLLALAVVLRPTSHAAPTVTHAQRLDRALPDLPTLTPLP